MNVKNNRRRRESVEQIEKVFLDLLANRELSQIRVVEICQAANINRSTFYANFADVYDLAEKMRLRLQSEAHPLLVKEGHLHYGVEDYLSLLQHIRDNQSLYSFYFKLGYDKSADLKLYDLSELQDIMDPRFVDYHVAFFESGFNAIVKRWLSRGCAETPEEILGILLNEYRGRHRSRSKG